VEIALRESPETAALVGAVAASRFQRVREAVLLRTLGATRGQLLRILLAEYASLGVLAAATAILLSAAAAWALPPAGGKSYQSTSPVPDQ